MPSSVPLVDDETRRSLAGYPNRPDVKALAIAGVGMGVADGQPNAEAAKQDALRRCDARTKGQCRLYAVGMDVVWSKEALPMPAPDDLRFEPLDAPLVPDEIPTHQSRAAGSDRTDAYEARPTIGRWPSAKGVAWTQSARDTRAEAARLALERCAEHSQRPCLLLSVDGLLTIRIPKSRQVIRIFLPSAEAEISASDRERIGQIYQGRGMAGTRQGQERQLARGRSRALGGGRDREPRSNPAHRPTPNVGSTRGNFRVAEE